MSHQSLSYRNPSIDPSIPLLPIGHFMSIPNCPGRRTQHTPLDSSPSKSYGDAIIQKSDNTVRLFFQNVHGLSSSLGSEDYNTHFVDFIDQCALFDLHANDPAESTYIGAESCRIDFIFGCHHARQFLERSGTLAYNKGPQSDHRGLYVDLKLKFFRGLRQYCPIRLARCIQAILNLLLNTMTKSWSNDLHNNYKSMSRDDIREQLIGWDNDKGRAMKAAEKVLTRPPKKCLWSPILRNRAFTRLYWKLQLREIQEGKNYSATFIRWQDQLQMHDKTFSFPSINEELSLDEVRAQFNKASSEFYMHMSS